MNDSYRVAVIGSDEDNLSDIEKERLYPLCISLGKKLADNNCVVFTGGDRGIGLKVLQGVCENGGMTVVFFPGQENTLPMDVVKIPIYTGVGYGIRDILMLRTVDAVVSLAGGAGTLNELANAYHLYKPIITLKNSGGWTERLEDTYIDSKKKTKIISCNTIDELLQTLLHEISKVRRFKYLNKKMLYEVNRV